MVIYCLGLARVGKVQDLFGLFVYLGILFILFVIGVWAATLAETFLGKKDCRHIVFDEIFGYLVAMFGLPPEPFYIIIAFILFRILDVFKPPPISRLQVYRGGLGIMLDDAVAGAATCLILHIVVLIRWLFRF